jgi:hypothetical protein
MIALGAATAGAVLQFGRLGDEVQKMSIRTGFSTESLSELRFAMEQAGTSIQGFEVGVRRMSGFIEDAKDGLATSTDAMDKLGVSVDDLKGKSPEEAFFVLANAMAGIEDELTKAALAQDVFGRSGTQLLPLLAEGADGIEKLRQEARDLGIVMDQETANKAAKMQDAINSAKQSMNGLAISIGSTLAPAITLIAKTFSVLPAQLRAVTVAAGIFFTAMKVGLISLRGAIISTGIGALIVAVGMLADRFGLLGSAASDAADDTEKLNDKVKMLQEAAGRAGDTLTTTDAKFKSLGLAAEFARTTLAGLAEEEEKAAKILEAANGAWAENADALDDAGRRIAIILPNLTEANTDLEAATKSVLDVIKREGITLDRLTPIIDELNLSTETYNELMAAAAIETAKLAQEIDDLGLTARDVNRLRVQSEQEASVRIQGYIDSATAKTVEAAAVKAQIVLDEIAAAKEAADAVLAEAERQSVGKERFLMAQIDNAKAVADAEIAEAKRVADARITEESRVQGILNTLRGRFNVDQIQALGKRLKGSLTQGEAFTNLQSLLEAQARTALQTGDSRRTDLGVNVGAAGGLLGIQNQTSGSGLDIVSQLGALPSAFEGVIRALARATGQQVQISMAPGAGDMIVAEVVNSQLNGAEL